MNPITFLQLRPAESVNEIWATTRRREGALAVEVPKPTLVDIVAAHKAGLLLVSGDEGALAPAYAVVPGKTRELRKGGVAGWRITIVNEGNAMDVADALAFTLQP